MSDFESRPRVPAPATAPFRGLRQVAPPPPERPEPDVWDQRVAGALAFLRRRLTGDYEVDEFGFDAEFTAGFVHPVWRFFYRRYFRIETRQAKQLPDTGPALVVANHSGTVPMDALMLSMA